MSGVSSLINYTPRSFPNIAGNNAQWFTIEFGNISKAINSIEQFLKSLTGGGGGVSPSPLTKIDDTNVTLALGGTPATALLQAVSLTLGWTGTLAVPRGGLGVGTLASNGVLYGNGTSAVQVTAAGGANSVLTANSGAPSFSSSPTLTGLNVTGSGSIGALTLSLMPVGGPIFLDNASNILYAGNISIVAPGQNSVVGNGSTNDEAAIATLLAATSETHFLPTANSYRIATNLTVGNGKRIVIHAGAIIKVATGITLDFSGSEVIAPLGIQCFSLVGTGKVIGLSTASPEMFGAAKNGSTDDGAAINACFTSVFSTSAHPVVGRRKAKFSAGIYAVGTQIGFTMVAGVGHLIEGAGKESFGPLPGTQLLGLSTGNSSSAMLAIKPTSGGQDQFELKDISLINQTAGSGFNVGLYFGLTGGVSGYGALSDKRFTRVFASGFSFANFELQNTSTTTWRDCNATCFDSVGTKTSSGAYALYYLCDGGGSAGHDFQFCQFEADTGGNFIVVVTDNGVAGGNAAGIKFDKCDFYQPNNSSGLLLNASGGSGSAIGDVWITDCGFESQTPGNSATAIKMSVSNGGQIGDVHIRGNYIASDGWLHHVWGIANDNLSALFNIYITENKLLNPSQESVLIEGQNTGGGNWCYTVANNQFLYITNYAGATVEFNNLVGIINVTGNIGCNVPSFPAATRGTGIELGGLGGTAVIVGNTWGATTPVNAGTWTNVSQANNI